MSPSLLARLAKPGAFRVWRHHDNEDFRLFRLAIQQQKNMPLIKQIEDTECMQYFYRPPCYGAGNTAPFAGARQMEQE